LKSKFQFYISFSNIFTSIPWLPQVDHKALEAYHAEVDELFFSWYDVTQQGLIQKDVPSIIIRKAEVTPEVWSN
jgi:hypothetical protein